MSLDVGIESRDQKRDVRMATMLKGMDMQLKREHDWDLTNMGHEAKAFQGCRFDAYRLIDIYVRFCVFSHWGY